MTRNEPAASARGAPPGTGPVLVAAGTWLLAAILLGASGWLRTLRPPAPQLILVGITIALLVAGRTWPRSGSSCGSSTCARSSCST